ncbi:PEP-CTERM sorting domain-containing protein [Rubritalea spongiae]|uniref:PEP-CTERM sorting domain-containing protein n=1 Tax=Rubritalea spongiae TaxID=430797 RepID=A0ABW5DZM4_9BACT
MKHPLKSICTLVATLITFGSLAGGANGAVIVDNLESNQLTGQTNDYGQSFIFSNGTSWNSLTVSLFSTAGNPSATPFAAGTLFLLDSEYLGAQAALSPATAGFIAETSNVINGEWVFNPTKSIDANTQYWIYTQGEAITPIAFNDSNNYADGIAYQDTGGGYGAASYADLAFSIQGSAVPEPSSVFLFGIGSLLGFTVRRRRVN